MRVYIGADHAAYELKNRIVDHVRDNGHEPIDCGPYAYDANDDYPVFVLRTAERVAGDPGSLGVVLGGSGNGEAIAANKVKGIRAALAFSEETAQLAREHNDANVLSLGARVYDEDKALRFVDVFVSTPFSGDERHVRRIEMLSRYEEDGSLPPLPAGVEEPPGVDG
ncbi:MAG: ribose 5-phosphate isomerase [Frankiales bacterium]|jgi:ribose 5-phosphate isomerase B|nr:ribose 5-phosphate isomerase [Frankiales bacterium]